MFSFIARIYPPVISGSVVADGSISSTSTADPDALAEHVAAPVFTVDVQIDRQLSGRIGKSESSSHMEDEAIAEQARVKGVGEQYPMLAFSHSQEVGALDQ